MKSLYLLATLVTIFSVFKQTVSLAASTYYWARYISYNPFSYDVDDSSIAYPSNHTIQYSQQDSAFDGSTRALGDSSNTLIQEEGDDSTYPTNEIVTYIYSGSTLTEGSQTYYAAYTNFLPGIGLSSDRFYVADITDDIDSCTTGEPIVYTLNIIYFECITEASSYYNNMYIDSANDHYKLLYNPSGPTYYTSDYDGGFTYSEDKVFPFDKVCT